MYKSFFLSAVLLISSSQISGQNWAPFTPDEKFHFTNSGEPSITNTIHVDSIQVGDVSTYYFLNKVVLPCDTCMADTYGLDDWQCPENSCLYLKDQPQFLNSEVIESPGGMWTFIHPIDFVLMTHAEIGEMWNFDGVQNAQVTSISTQDIFSTVDSVKNITVDDGQEFLLSKEHGLLRYYNPNEEEELFELIGIQGRDVGLLVPELEEIFDHQVGDVIQYKYKIYSEGNAQQVDGIIKRTILEVESTPEEITLHYDEVSQHTYGHWGPPDQSYPPTTYYHAFTANETFTLEDYLFLEEDVHEHSKANFGVYADSIPLPEGDVSDYIVTLTSENDRMIKKYGIHIGMDTESLQSLEGQELGSILLAIEEYSPVIFREELYSNMFEDTPLFWFAADHNVYRENLGMSFTEGLGMTSYLWAGGIGSSMGLWMTGYVHQGDTTGVIDSDSYILTSDEYGMEESITVFTNPANDMLYLHWPGDELLEEVEILDNHGRVIDQPKQNGSAQGRNSIDISSFPSGLYLLLLRTDNSEYIGKFIKE